MMRSSSTTSVLAAAAATILLPLLLIINPSHAAFLESGLPSNVDAFDKAEFNNHWISALFVFGDSLVDSGNNNFLSTLVKANYPPYGSTFFPHATGRFTDGRHAADFIAQLNGLPYPPPYLGLKNESKPIPKTGVNFASASSGILPDTGKFMGNCLSLDEQIKLFEEVTKELKKQFKTEEEFSKHISKAVFYINAGSNDYVLGYFNNLTGLAQKFAPQAFPVFLADQLSIRLKKLYEMGARKMLVNNVGAIGCTPALLNTNKLQTPCDNLPNLAVSGFNALLPQLLAKLQLDLPQSNFVLGDVFKLFLDIKALPAAYQISDTANTCCVDIAGNGATPCKPNTPPCKDVKSHLFFDMAHPTQTVHYLLVKRCFNDPTICAPLNLSQLMTA